MKRDSELPLYINIYQENITTLHISLINFVISYSKKDVQNILERWLEQTREDGFIEIRVVANLMSLRLQWKYIPKKFCLLYFASIENFLNSKSPFSNPTQFSEWKPFEKNICKDQTQ